MTQIEILGVFIILRFKVENIYIYRFVWGLNFYKFHEFRRITRKLLTKCYKYQVETKNTTRIILK